MSMILILRRRDKEEGHHMNTLVDLILELRVPLSNQRAKVLECFAPAAAKTRLTTFLGCILRLLNSKLSFSPSLTVQMEESLFFFFIFRFATPLLSLASGTQQTNKQNCHLRMMIYCTCWSLTWPPVCPVTSRIPRPSAQLCSEFWERCWWRTPGLCTPSSSRCCPLLQSVGKDTLKRH